MIPALPASHPKLSRVEQRQATPAEHYLCYRLISKRNNGVVLRQFGDGLLFSNKLTNRPENSALGDPSPSLNFSVPGMQHSLCG